MKKLTQWCLLIACLATVLPVQAMPEFFIELRDHLFIPQEIKIPAHKKVRITIINHDPTPEEIDSFDLNREKVVFGNSRATIYVGPLPPGEYNFFGEYHPNSALGVVQVVPQKEMNNAN